MQIYHSKQKSPSPYEGMTAEELAREKGHEELAKVLEEKRLEKESEQTEAKAKSGGEE